MTKAFKTRKRLPNKPSALIRLALEDLRSVEKSDKYSINMSEAWHKSWYYTKCEVCFAGAVMARTLKVPSTQDATPGRFTSEVLRNKFIALDHFRRGDIGSALMDLNLRTPKRLPNFESVHTYENNPSLFKYDMMTIVHMLEKVGL